MKTILVTGGAGFLGSNLVHSLVARGTHRIVVCDHLGADDKWRNLLSSPIDEVVSPPNLFYWLEMQPEDSVDAILHFGTPASTTEGDVGLLVEANLNLSSLLWRWCAENGVRFFYASSFGVYGQGENGCADGEDLAAMAKLRPVNPQGWSKLLFDRFAARQSHTGQAPKQWAGLRFYSLYGPNEYHKGDQRSVIHKAFPNVMGGHAVKLFRPSHASYQAPGSITRDFTYVLDAAKVVLWLLDNPQVSGIFNMGSGEAIGFEAMAEALGTALGKKAQVKYVEMPQEIERGYQYQTHSSNSRLKTAGYTTPILGVADGIKHYVDHFLSKENPYR